MRDQLVELRGLLEEAVDDQATAKAAKEAIKQLDAMEHEVAMVLARLNPAAEKFDVAFEELRKTKEYGLLNPVDDFQRKVIGSTRKDLGRPGAIGMIPNLNAFLKWVKGVRSSLQKF